MKSLEEVIKYKLNFLPEEIDPFYAIQTYGGGWYGHTYVLYRTKNEILSNDTFSLMEDITPLFIYISSCDKYYRENGHGEIVFLSIRLDVAGITSLGFCQLNTYDDDGNDLEEYRIGIFKNYINEGVSRAGHCDHYTKPFTIEIHAEFNYFRTEEERHRCEAELRRAYLMEIHCRRPEAKSSINDSRTFKLEQCVICLEKEPKVLFCNCGHICICDECSVKKLDNCPVCKKKNTNLRIIE